MGQELSGLDLNELQNLESQLEMSLKNIRTRKVFIGIQVWKLNPTSIRNELIEWYIKRGFLVVPVYSLI